MEALSTSNGFEAIRRNGVRIGWIRTRGAFTVDSAEIVAFARDGQFASDHFPVVTRLRMRDAKVTTGSEAVDSQRRSGNGRSL
jgi:hypothetical protein